MKQTEKDQSRPDALITHERLREVLHYDIETGVFTWLKTISSHAVTGKSAGSKKARGQIAIQIDGEMYTANRLAVFWVTGTWPDGVVIPRDGNIENRSFGNLVVASKSARMQRQSKPHKRSTSGILGVTFHKQSGKWAVQLVKKGVRKRHYGLFASKDQAGEQYRLIKRRLHGLHPSP